MDLERALSQAEMFFGLKDFKAIPGMRALVERQALAAAAGPAERSGRRPRV